MVSKQSAAVVDLSWRWLRFPGADHGRTPRDNRVSTDDWDAVARLADWSRPRFAA